MEGADQLLAFTFPGQGSQRHGMGSSWVDHPSFELVEQASEAVGRDVAHLLLGMDQESLTSTENAQLATFVLSLVILDATERLGITPTMCAGHSLGEYSALVASGALSFDDGVRLVNERGLAMKDAATKSSGTMMAILGLDDDSAEAACMRAEGDVWIANFNAPGQIVIAGAPDDLLRAAEIAKELGAKRVMSFPVGGAFHTPYMAPARDLLRKALAGVSFREPDPPVVANVDARIHEDPDEWPGLLSAQLCSPVRWHQSLQTLYESGVRTFVELGAGAVLTGLVKRSISQGITALNVATPEELEALVDVIAGTEAASVRELERTAGFVMTERLIVAPATGPFRPASDLIEAAPTLSRAAATRGVISLGVGDLVGWAGEIEIRSPFAGELQGIIVLAGERVVTGQPVAWLRTTQESAMSIKES
ncbi:MAG TPA: ACP S-malonyltransferase [Acidimicrobiales bacterium]|nr:ACP S-malonyltransferase [Acidimicrobiales bacterium]